MSEPEAVKEFKEGLKLLTNEYAGKALGHFTRAASLDNKNPFYISYQGLALAAAHQKWEQAEELCYTALRMMRTQAEMYLNLAEVYRLAGRRQDAIETLNEGLPLTKYDPRLQKKLDMYGVRRLPVLPFLARGHFLNRHLGVLRYKILKSLGKAY